MSKFILEIKEGSYADHEYPAEEWHRIELDLDSAKMRPLIRCRDCRWGQVVDEIGCIRMHDRFTRSAPPHDPDGFCAWGEPKEEA